MASDDKVRAHNLRLDQNKTLSVSGVKNVPTFNSKQIVVDLGNQSLCVTGSDLNITSLDLDTGLMSATGHINALKYSTQFDAKSFFKKLFK